MSVAGGGMATLVTARVFPPGSMSPAQDDTSLSIQPLGIIVVHCMLHPPDDKHYGGFPLEC